MRLLIVTCFCFCYSVSYAQSNTSVKKINQLIAQQKTDEAESFAINQLQQTFQQKQFQLLNNEFFLYLTVLKHYKNTAAFNKAINYYKKIIQQPYYTYLHDSLKVQNAIEYGLILAKNNQFVESLEVYEETLNTFKRYLETDVISKALLLIETSWNHSSLGNQKNEVDFVQKAIDVMEANFSKIKEVDFITAYNNLFYYYGEYDDAQKQLETYKKYSKYYLAKYAKNNNTRNYYYAKRVYRKMQIISSALENKADQARALLKLMKQEIAQSPLIEKAEDINYYLSCLSALCDYYYFTSFNSVEGIKIGKQFLQEATQQKSVFYIMLAHSKLANQYREIKLFDSALYHVNASLSSFQFPPTSLSKFGLETMKALNLSSVAKHNDAIAIMENNILTIIQEHTNKKIGILQINPPELKELNNSRYINIFATSALIFLEAYQYKKESTFINKAEKLVETAAYMFGEFYKKGSYNSTLSSLQNKIVEAYLYIITQKYENNLAQKKNIVQLIEANASFHLAKEFEQKLLKNNTAIGNLLNEESLLIQQKEFYTTQQIEKGNNANYSTKIKLLDSKLKNVQQQIVTARKGFTNLTLDNFSVNNCMQLLHNDEAIVKFYVANKHVYRIILSQKNIDVKQLSTIEQTEKITKEYLSALKSIQPNFKQLSTTLYNQLAANILQKNITIIPDNYLNYLPFESLQNPSSKAFLVQEANINYNYSFSLWYLHQLNNKHKKDINLAAFAPNYNNTFFDSIQLQNLPFAKQEANYVAQLFKGKEFVGEIATKQNFFSNQQAFNVLHFSMHTVLFDNDFNKSCLLFNNAQPLYFSELYNTAIPAEMIVLSACNTGAGKLLAGEGIMSLSKALTYAGVKSTVVSLWQVPDKETSHLMALYYQFLKKGKSKSEALALAKSTFIKNNPLKIHPYYWSGFILTGNDEAIVQNYNWLYYVLTSIALVVLIFFIAKRKKKKLFINFQLFI